jgi:Tol biopolymer transport system component
MTTIDRSDRFEHELPDALSDVAGTGRSDYLTDILGRTARTSQRPAWASIERWLPVDLVTVRAPIARFPWRPILVAALVIALVVAALAVFVGGQRRLPPPFGPAANGLIPYSANGDIFVGDPLTGVTRTIFSDPSNTYIPSFSPDGSHVSFLRASADCPTPGDVCPGGEDIVVADSDGRNAHALSDRPFVGLRIVTWAPDSRRILVGSGPDRSLRLAMLPIDGGPPSVIAEMSDADWAAFRPPAGDELLVRGTVDGQFGLFRMHADGSGRELLVAGATPGETTADNQDLNFPTYSPDGARIFYNRYVDAAQTIQAWVMNADGSSQRRLNGAGPACCWWEGEVAPSPDGKWVVMWRVPPPGQGDSAITIFAADGSGDGREVGPQVKGTAHWVWSPDSTKLLLNFNDPTEGDEGVIDVVTGAFTKLPWNADTEPDWQRTAR